MLYLYYYKALCGYEMPEVHRGELTTLEARFNRSETPLVRVIPITSDEVRAAVKGVLQAQLTATAGNELGLVSNLTRAIKALD